MTGANIAEMAQNGSWYYPRTWQASNGTVIVHALAGDAVDVGFLWRDRAQIEQGESERRMHERGLHVDAENDAEPDQVDAELFRGRPEQRDDDEGEFEEVEEEGENEHEAR